eukprot:1327604-Amphidinium_carterae.1
MESKAQEQQRDLRMGSCQNPKLLVSAAQVVERRGEDLHPCSTRMPEGGDVLSWSWWRSQQRSYAVDSVKDDSRHAPK